MTETTTNYTGRISEMNCPAIEQAQALAEYLNLGDWTHIYKIHEDSIGTDDWMPDNWQEWMIDDKIYKVFTAEGASLFSEILAYELGTGYGITQDFYFNELWKAVDGVCIEWERYELEPDNPITYNIYYYILPIDRVPKHWFSIDVRDVWNRYKENT